MALPPQIINSRFAVPALAAASAVAVLIGNRSGLAVGDDGVGYEAIADNLSAGKGLGYFLEPKLTIWPPGWPTAMSVLDRLTPLDAEGAAIWLNALTTVGIVLVFSALLRSMVHSRPFLLAGTATVALGCSSMLLGHLLMTDFAFMLVALCAFALLTLPESPKLHHWFLAGCAIAVAFLIRYAGIVFLGIIPLWALSCHKLTLPDRIKRCVAFGLPAGTTMLLWVLRNRSIDGTALGVRYSSNRGLVANTIDLIATLGNFLNPGVAIDLRLIWFIVGLIGVSVMAAFTARSLGVSELKVGSEHGLLRVHPRRLWMQLGGTLPGLLVIHTATYALYMLYARTTTGLNQLDFRLLNPLYLPLVLLAILTLDRVARSNPGIWARAATAALALWTALNLALGIGMVAYFQSGPDLFGGNYSGPTFDRARRSEALDAIPSDCRLLSNLPNGLYEADLEAQWSPRLTGLESFDPVNDLEVVRRDLRADRICLAWIDLPPNYGHLVPLSQLRKEFTLKTLASDGPVTTYEILLK